MICQCGNDKFEFSYKTLQQTGKYYAKCTKCGKVYYAFGKKKKCVYCGKEYYEVSWDNPGFCWNCHHSFTD